MHCVLLGVVKMLLNLWFDKLHRNSIFSISSKIQEVDQRQTTEFYHKTAKISY